MPQFPGSVAFHSFGSPLMFRSFILSTVLAASLFSPAFAEEQKVTRTISLTGHGEVRVVPDTAVVISGVMSSAATAREALDANTAAMAAVMAALKTAGIDPRDIQTSNFMVNPRYDYGQNGNQVPKTVGYDVSNNVTVVVRKLDNLGKLLDQLVTSGSNQINGISFQVTDPQKAEDLAREEAVKDAMRKSAIYTKASATTLGSIMSISEGQVMPQQTPVFYAKSARADGGADVPVSQGEQAISIDVNIVWEIK
jgi:uncharacterized protein